jgi:preprotein translocase subunit SecF
MKDVLGVPESFFMLYDTIVAFDQVRNDRALGRKRRAVLEQLLNRLLDDGLALEV